MILDCHTHIEHPENGKDKLLSDMNQAGVKGGILLSYPPADYLNMPREFTTAERIENLLSWCNGPNLSPFYWIDPLEEDALEQVGEAVERGVSGFKIICDRFFPHDECNIKVCKAIAEVRRPVLFHSGIIWNTRASSRYNRPAEFEALLEIPKLRFALAHISWPWCDELIAVYGKAQELKKMRAGLGSEMFIDTTPGTPPIYRQEALTKLYTVGYPVSDNVIFGLDNISSKYNMDWAKEWIERDTEILKKLEVSDNEIEKYFTGNLTRFLSPIE